MIILSVKEIAQKVVQTSLRIGEDDQVLIEGWEHTLDLIESLALECYHVGAVPLIVLVTGKLYEKILQEIPEGYLAKVPQHLLATYDAITAAIWISGPKDPKIFFEASPHRVTTFFQSSKLIEEKWMARKIRCARLELGVVTPERAKIYEVNFEKWLNASKNALTVDYERMINTGRKLANALMDGEEIKITSKAGTALLLSIRDRPVFIQDGIVSDEDIERGFPFVFLPSGYVAIAPIETSSEGRVVFDAPSPLWGKVIWDLNLKFENGRLVEIAALKNKKVFEKVFEERSGDKDRIGELRIGINNKSEFVGYETIDPIVEGAVSIGMGNNKHMRGKNESDFMFLGTMKKATLEIDGKVIVSEGKIGV